MKILREYRVLPEWSGYICSSDGFFYSLRNGKFKKLKTVKHYSGYGQVGLYGDDGKQHSKRANRLIYEAFYGEIPDGMQVNHNDENKLNNAIDNLSLMTPKENSNWGSRNERLAKSLSILNKGKIPSGNPPKAVNEYTMDGAFIKRWDCMSEAARELGLKQGHISLCCRGKRYSTGGRKWAYAS